MSDVVIGDILPYTQSPATSMGQTVFGTNWTANAASDVVVYYTPINTAPDDATQILAYPADYSVAFIGSQQEVQVTLVTGAINIGDIVTITRQTPADYLNLYSNTNFTPSMLNNDFSILTLVDQQAQLVNQLIGPRYNYSAVIAPNSMYPNANIILPILGDNQTWVMNSNSTEIITYDLPQSGIAPSDDYYVLLKPDSGLPNSQALSNLGATGILVWNQGTSLIVDTTIAGTTNQINVVNGNGIGTIGISISNNPILPGTAGFGVPAGTTAQRVIPTPPNINLRYNTDLLSLEYYNDTQWVEINDNTDGIVLDGLANQLAYYATSGNILSGLTSGNNGVLVTSNSGVPSISSTLPLAVQTNITELGTITVGVWNGSTIPVNHGGSGAITLTGLLTGNGTSAFTATAITQYNILSGGATNLPNSIAPSVTSGIPLISQGSSAQPIFGTAVVAGGGTGVTSVTIAPTASAFAGWDANSNLSANSFISGYATTATAGATTTLTVASAYQQFFTGSTTQTVVMPLTSTLVVGQQWYLVNNSTGNVTVNTSNGTNILTMTTDTTCLITCVLNSGTTAASWYYDFNSQIETHGTVTSVSTGTGLTGGPITTAGTISLVVPVVLADGGTNNASLTASNGGIVWSDASKLNVLAGTATANQVLLSGSSTTPAWSTATYPATTTLNQLLYSSSANVIAGLATANNAVLVTSASGVPSLSTSLPAGLNVIQTIKKQVFTSSGTYTPSTGMQYCIVEAWGGGGGSGGSTGAVSQVGTTGGAASGSYSRSLITAATIGSSQTVTIGAAGSAGASGNNNGGSGGTTSLGSLVTAPGGGGSPGATSATTASVSNQGVPGGIGTGDLAVNGNPGGFGVAVSVNEPLAGNGGAPALGCGGIGAQNAGNAPASPACFGAGAGGCIGFNGTAAAGAAGSKGGIIITEFCNQ